MVFRTLLRPIQVLGIALFLFGLTAIALLYLPSLNAERAVLAEAAFERLLDCDVTISGDVDVTLGSTTRLALTRVALSKVPGSGSTATARIAQTVFEFPLVLALGGTFRPSTVSIAGMDFEITKSGVPAGKRESRRATLAFIRFILDREHTPKLTLEDIVIARHDDPGGWNYTLHLDTVVVDVGEKGRGTAIVKAAGALNEAAFEVTVNFDPVTGGTGSERAFVLNTGIAGAKAAAHGRIDPAADSIDARLDVDAASLSRLLEIIRLRPETDGEGKLTAHVRGAKGTYAAHDIKLDVGFESGDSAKIEGAIADLAELNGISLDFAVNRVTKAGAGGGSVLDIELRSLRGNVAGSRDELEIQRLLLSTNIASAELRNIGPISVAHVVRDPHGRLALLGVRLLEGDPARPVLDLFGDVRDAIGMSEISVHGRFDIDLVALLTHDPGKRGDMRLSGEVAASDASGRFAVDKIDARTSAGPFALILAKPDRDAVLHIDFNTSDIDAVAAALGRQPIGGGAAAFNGDFRVSDDLSLSGRAAIGKTDLSLSVSAGVRDGRPILRGSLNAAVLRLSDTRRAAALGDMFSRKPENLEFEASFAEGMDAEFDVTAQTLAGVAATDSRLDAHISYKERQAVVAPLKLSLYRGTIDARMTIDNRRAIPAASFKGDLARLDIPALLAQFEGEPYVSGTLDARFDLGSAGDTVTTLVRQLGGTLELALEDGVLEDRLIDLSGQDLISWFFSGGPGGQAHLTCAVAGLTFVHGSGTFAPLVVATENVRLTGQGDLNLSDDSLRVHFTPEPLRPGLADVVTRFGLEGPLTSPKVTGVEASDIAARAAEEAITLPLRPLDLLLRHADHVDPKRHPCANPVNAGGS